MKNIVETIIDTPMLSTLATAVKTANLVETLSAPGPFTVFAPTNDAFEKVKKEALDALLEDKGKLSSVLKYHTVSGTMMAKDIDEKKELETLQGKSLGINTEHDMMISDAHVVTTDIVCSNGVIHTIDTVLIP